MQWTGPLVPGIPPIDRQMGWLPGGAKSSCANSDASETNGPDSHITEVFSM
ncbi:MAG: hypothetical protein ACO3JG_03235 [Luteolibacter sp.]